jgi:hypothetical protein
MADSLLSVAEVARLTLAPLADVRGWVESGRLRSVPHPDSVGRVVRRADLEAFVAANGMPPLPPEGSPDPVDQFLAALPADLGAALRAEFPNADLDLPAGPRAALRAAFEREQAEAGGGCAEPLYGLESQEKKTLRRENPRSSPPIIRTKFKRHKNYFCRYYV